MEPIYYAQVGNTLRVNVETKDEHGNLRNLDNARFRLHDRYKGVLEEGLPINPSRGHYRYDFQVPDTAPRAHDIVVEFSGELDGKPIIKRKTLMREWAR